MLDFIQNQIFFYISLVIVLFLPGYFLLLAIYGQKKIFSSLEKFVIAVAFSIISVDFLMMIMDRAGILITRVSLLATLAIFVAICFVLYKIFPCRSDFAGEEEGSKLFSFSKKQTSLIIAILFLTVFIKAAYLGDNILPSATDLGHHMYWSKEIATTGKIQEYAQRDIQNVDGTYQIGPLKNISDFIIGEHLIFAGVAVLSGLDVLSYFPVIILLAVNLINLLAIFILVLRFFEKYPQAKNIAILSLFFLGPLFAVSPPEAKYVGGGVIGNIIGDLLMPVSFYFFYRALLENNRTHAAVAIFVTMGLFYTHHLTGFILLFILMIAIVLLVIFNVKSIRLMVKSWWKLFISWPVILFLVMALVFVFAVYTPSYLKNTAVKTVVGTASKADHTGLTFSQFKFSLGEPREILGFIGTALILWWLYKKRKEGEFGYAGLFLAAWIIVVFVVSLYPGVLMVDIPSARVSNYGSFPFSILAAFAVIELIGVIKSDTQNKDLLLNSKLISAVLVLLASFTVAEGFYDNAQNQVKTTGAQKIVQTYAASHFLAQKTDQSDQVIKDHVFMAADSWVKLFFMRDYNFPFYRANLERYANGVDKKEQCTLWMVSTPGSADSQKCYRDLKMDFVMVDKVDAPQFEKENGFQKVYDNGQINVFYRPQ